MSQVIYVAVVTKVGVRLGPWGRNLRGDGRSLFSVVRRGRWSRKRAICSSEFCLLVDSKVVGAKCQPLPRHLHRELSHQKNCTRAFSSRELLIMSVRSAAILNTIFEVVIFGLGALALFAAVLNA